MEDRLTPGLYLELAHDDPELYGAKRVPELLALPGVARASRWENLRPDRDEFERTIPEFPTLGVYEVDGAFRPPPGPHVGHHFLRHPRPPQGNLSGRPTRGLLLVLVSPVDASGAQALRDWADFTHIREIAAAGIEGFTMITVYENATGGTPRFLHLYELDAEDPEAAFQQMARRTLERRLGGPATPEAKAWFSHEQLVIDYVNTFRRLDPRDR